MVAVYGLKDDLLLDQVLVLVRAYPGRACTECRRVLFVLVCILNDVITSVRTHDIESVASRG